MKKTVLLGWSLALVIAAVTSCENELPTYLKYSAYEFSGLDEDGGSWQPILFSSATDIPVAPPAAVSSSEYQAELAALKSATRNLNASQRKAVDYWTNNPLIRWNEIALELAAKYNLIPPPTQTAPIRCPRLPIHKAHHLFPLRTRPTPAACWLTSVWPSSMG